ncbi:MAG: hypothetical protein K8Q92_04005 [Methylophilales bacterium]|nr:hypothetical protein [Methylophilales bacterium]
MLQAIKIIIALVLFSIAISSFAESQRFTVVGNGIIFALAEPSGWVMDTDSAHNNNLPVVYYPSGQTWNNAPAVMYANIAINDCHTTFENFISDDLAVFKSNSPKIVIKDGGAMTVDGKRAIIKLFNGDTYGNSEAVAYLDNMDGNFILFTLTSRTQQLFDEAFPVFKELISSFQLVGNSVICNSKLPSFAERVALAKRAEKQKDIGDYLYKEMFPAIGTYIANLMKSCLAKSNASVDKFTIVADVKEPGQFNAIDYQPRTNTASCFSEGLASLNLPDTKLCQCGSIPIVLDMSISP